MIDPKEILKEYAVKEEVVKPNRRAFFIHSSKIREVVTKLRDVYGGNIYVSAIVGVDNPENGSIDLSYFIHIVSLGETIVLRTSVPRDDPRIDSIVDILPSALASECETYDVLGVIFEGNPHLRRAFFVPKEIADQGIFPLRKDAKV